MMGPEDSNFGFGSIFRSKLLVSDVVEVLEFIFFQTKPFFLWAIEYMLVKDPCCHVLHSQDSSYIFKRGIPDSTFHVLETSTKNTSDFIVPHQNQPKMSGKSIIFSWILLRGSWAPTSWASLGAMLARFEKLKSPSYPSSHNHCNWDCRVVVVSL